MPSRSSTPGALRNRRYRRRLREELTLAHSEVPWSVIKTFIEGGWLSEDESRDPHRLGEAVLKAAEERLRQGF